ncbi:hypothetical protein [Nocardioides plantarum]|uniref:Pre-peptidase n=1 Tax=Nocardioides plantarum TaxID=29299 RepID=A0ABV5KAH1_9ACTN|nr:hypothetical protein [Nocardioides plantarum]
MTRPVRRSRRPARAAGSVGIALTALAVGGASLAAPAQHDAGASSDQQRALAAGLQVGPKTDAGATGANPYLANLPDESRVDFAAWRQRLSSAADRRAGSAAYRQARSEANAVTPAAATVVSYDEQEPTGTSGSNDTDATAERISVFGTTKSKRNVVRINGTRAELPTPTPVALPTGAEDNGAIPLATPTDIDGSSALTTTGVLGDGPHGSAGDGTNDFDFYAVDLTEGLTLTADTSSADSGTPDGTDTVAVLYDADGEIVASDDDGGTGTASLLEYDVAASGTYYLLVAGYADLGPLPEDPTDSGSGAGGAEEGDYSLAITQSASDRDKYSINLHPGDVIGAVAQGGADTLTVTRPDGTQAVGAPGVDASSLYPPDSPLPGGGNTSFGYVAEQGGLYVIDVSGAIGSYTVQVEGYRPGAQVDTNKSQVVYLDFEGGRVNTAVWGGAGVRELSPFKSFLGKWGISQSRERAMIDKITYVVRQNLLEAGQNGLNNPKVTVVNSRTHPELRGRANVSRVIVGGTIDQSGISTIGIAQYIDPGNYGHEDTALVLLDVLSDPDGPASLNTYLTAASDRERFVGRAVGNVTAHEIGHLVGSYHTDNASDDVNLMDSGGANFQNLFGVGPDNVGGTADDLDVRFGEDVYSPAEGFTGTEDTQNNTAFAYPKR